MFDEVIGWVFLIFMAAMYLGGIVMWIYIGYYKIKCWKISGCKNENCRNRGHCEKTAWTENEVRQIQELIDRLKN